MASSSRPGRRWLLLLLLTFLGTAGWLAWTRFFPPPADASAAAIGRWLAKRDLSQVSHDTQLALVDRLQQLLMAEAGPAAFSEADPDDLEKLTANMHLLSQVWFLARAREYQQYLPAARMPYLRQQVDAVVVWGDFDNQLQDRLRQHAGLESETSRLRLLDDIDGWIRAEPAGQQEGLRHALHDAVLCWLATSEVREQEMSIRREAAERISSALDSGAATAAGRLELNTQHQDRLLRNSWLLLEAWFRNRAEEFSNLPVRQRTRFIEDQLDKVSSWQLDRVMVIDSSEETAVPRPDDARLLEVVSQLLAQFPDWIEQAPPEERDAVAHLAEELKHNLAIYMLKKVLPDFLPGLP
jgi:hypothetical protein